MDVNCMYSCKKDERVLIDCQCMSVCIILTAFGSVSHVIQYRMEIMTAYFVLFCLIGHYTANFNGFLLLRLHQD